MEKKNFHEKKVAVIIKQILSAIYYCHENNVVHRSDFGLFFEIKIRGRDIKPENILFETDSDEARLKMIDFGTARNFTKGHKMKEKIGTVHLFTLN